MQRSDLVQALSVRMHAFVCAWELCVCVCMHMRLCVFGNHVCAHACVCVCLGTVCACMHAFVCAWEPHDKLRCNSPGTIHLFNIFFILLFFLDRISH